MKTLFAAGAAAVTLALLACPASAQQTVVPMQQWCAVDSDNGDIDSCTYATLQQCLLSFNQTSGICYENLTYQQQQPITIARPRKVRSRQS